MSCRRRTTSVSSASKVRGGHGQDDLLYNKLPRKWILAGYRDRSAVSSFIAGLIEMIQARHSGLAGTATEATAAEPHGRTYPFRGMIDLIDWGMDQLAGRINRTGVAANISSHLMWRSVADQAISDYRRDPKPITAIGHSIGGDAAVDSPSISRLRMSR